MGRPRRNLVVTLRPEDWDRLVMQAKDAERDPWQHARYLVLRGLDHADVSGQDDLSPRLEETITADVA